MNAMDVIVLCLIGLTVLIVSIIQYIESVQQVAEVNEEEENPACVSGQKLDFSRWILSITESNGDGISEKRGIIDQESCFSNGFVGMSGNNADNISENREIIDQESDSCSGFSGISENNGGDICGKNVIIDQESDSCNGFSGISENSGDDNNNNGEGEGEFVDDWEGIERTELEKIFGEALIFVNCKSNADQIIGDLKLQLYGLQRVALDGPCRRPQPMALKVSSRSKWNAWQKLGNMSRETAMQMYVDVLSKAIPHWKREDTLTNQDDTASSSSSSSSVSVSGPECGPVTEEEIRCVLSDKTQPMTTHDLVLKFRSRLKLKEEKDAFAAVLRRITKIDKTNESKNYVVLRGDINSALPT